MGLNIVFLITHVKKLSHISDKLVVANKNPYAIIALLKGEKSFRKEGLFLE